MFHINASFYLDYIDRTYNFHQEKQQQYTCILYCFASKAIVFKSKNFKELLKDHFSNDLSLFWSSVFELKSKSRLYLSQEDFTWLQIAYWKTFLKDNTFDNISWLNQTYLTDQFIKVDQLNCEESYYKFSRNLQKYSINELNIIYKSIPNTNYITNNYSQISFEYLLAEYLNNNQKYLNAFYNKIEYFCLEQIIQEFFVIRTQLINGLYNNINLLLPEKHQVDENEDILIQALGNPYLSWMFDPMFRLDEIKYIQNTYDFSIFFHFYDGWIKYRAPNKINSEDEVKKDNINWIINAIKNKEWDLLVQKNLERNFGCVYVDNHLILKANQIWTGLLYRDYNHKTQNHIQRLLLK